MNTNGFDAIFGASGAAHSAGSVPDPGATPGTSRVLWENAVWNSIAYLAGGMEALVSSLTNDVSGEMLANQWGTFELADLAVGIGTFLVGLVGSVKIGVGDGIPNLNFSLRVRGVNTGVISSTNLYSDIVSTPGELGDATLYFGYSFITLALQNFGDNDTLVAESWTQYLMNNVIYQSGQSIGGGKCTQMFALRLA